MGVPASMRVRTASCWARHAATWRAVLSRGISKYPSPGVKDSGRDAELKQIAYACGVVDAGEVREEGSTLCEECVGEVWIFRRKLADGGFIVLRAGGDELV